ncbi:MAG TPA: glycoside hydrolase family 2 TIM barrel-domain containing protein [Opitutaceae bacterium]|nr:glycoside hydrolase family 2 TIM barrel-domain containing protein [Opitutaceae bacterium]
MNAFTNRNVRHRWGRSALCPQSRLTVAGLRRAVTATLRPLSRGVPVVALAAGLLSLPSSVIAESNPAPTETAIQYLSGRGTDDAVLWDFYCTGGRHSGVWSKIHVPSCWEQEGFGTYQYGLEARGKKAAPPASEVGKYRYQFSVPAGWQGRTVRIVFDGAMTDAAVLINGQSAGPVHQGAFYSFSYDITRLLKFGADNLLEVTVAKESANRSVNAAERRGDYWNFGGIFRPVFLEAFPAEHIDRVAIDAQADGRFTAQVFLSGVAEAKARVTAVIIDQQGRAFELPFSADVSRAGPAGAPPEIGSTEVTLHDNARTRPALWTAETPNLYTARFTLVVAGKPRHVVTQRFGYRTFEVRPRDGLYLNGQKIMMKGCDRHSFWPETGRALSRARNFADVRLMKKMNMNAVRMSHYPPDRDFLEACDELGLYVLDELAGWHGHYDTETGKKLVAEMVQRDVNHPSILFWDNGNETGWNTALDGEFDKWDPQNRRVLHPLAKFSDVETMHYRSYPETQEYLARGDIFMPTEFLHGLFDGGHGAGLWDYWELMRKSPNSAGGFLWSFADEGVARTDEGGRIDNKGSWAPDGIVGPHHEREGSFNAIREIWSPVVITGPDRLPVDFDGRFPVENRFDFTNLSACSFEWELATFAAPDAGTAGHAVIARGTQTGPSVAAHAAGVLAIHLPPNWCEADVLYVTARNPWGRKLWTWSWPVSAPPTRLRDAMPSPGARATFQETADAVTVSAGQLELRFSKRTGLLAGVVRDGHRVSLSNGPRVVAFRRGDRRADGSIEPKVPKGVDRQYFDVATPGTLKSLQAHHDGANVVIDATFAAVDRTSTGSLRDAHWVISPGGDVRLDYDYTFGGVVDAVGVAFDYPEADMRSIRWLGDGPYRVWQNRTQGTTLDVWQNAYNDAVPGVSFTYPEFKGFFRGWRWVDFTTSEGHLRIASDSPNLYLGVYTPRDGADALLYTFPPVDLAFWDVIPPVRNKVNATDLIGPHSQPQRLDGVQHRTVRFRFDAN